MNVRGQLAAVGVLMLVACGSDSEPQSMITADGGAEDATTQEQQPASDPLGAACDACKGQRCVGLRVSVDQNSPELPWKQFDESTGNGMLTAGIGMNIEQREATLADGFEGELFTFCTDAEEVMAICYLDDAGNGTKPLAEIKGGSGDYRDACPSMRNLRVSTKPDSSVMIECILSQSCD